MKITTITIGKSVTMMPQPYQSVKVDISFTAELGDREPEQDAIIKLNDMVDDYINDEFNKYE